MAKTYLVTGGAGFIGSNFVLYMLHKYDDIKIVNVDLLTYAGNLENLASIESDERHVFVQADIRDAQAIAALFEKYDIDYVVNFAAESHVDRSIVDPGAFASTNVMGTVNMLNCTRAAWEREDGSYPEGKKYLQVSTDEVYGSLSIDEPDTFFREDTPINPHSPYSASKASADLFVKAYGDTYGMPVNITRCSNNYGPFQFPEKLIPLMINNAEGAQGAPRLRRRSQRARLAVCRGPLQGNRPRAFEGAPGRGIQRGWPQRKAQHLHREEDHPRKLHVRRVTRLSPRTSSSMCRIGRATTDATASRRTRLRRSSAGSPRRASRTVS
jgi:nucleoside-diphosphate-sugar epimerase